MGCICSSTVVHSAVLKHLVLTPPNPSSIQRVEVDGQPDEYEVQLLSSCCGMRKQVRRRGVPSIIWIDTAAGTRLATLFRRSEAQDAIQGVTTLIFSHGSGSDLGLEAPYLRHFERGLGVHVIGYDYAGYGLSEGTVSESAVRTNIFDVYAALVAGGTYHESAVPPHQILLYGQSMGCVPTLELAARVPVAGVVMETPLLSVLRTRCNCCLPTMQQHLDNVRTALVDAGQSGSAPNEQTHGAVRTEDVQVELSQLPQDETCSSRTVLSPPDRIWERKNSDEPTRRSEHVAAALQEAQRASECGAGPMSVVHLLARAGASCPHLILHGNADYVVPQWHGREVAHRMAANQPQAWKCDNVWVRGAGHYDIRQVMGTPAYFDALRGFARFCLLLSRSRLKPPTPTVGVAPSTDIIVEQPALSSDSDAHSGD